MKYKIYTTSDFLKKLNDISMFYKNKNNVKYSFKLIDKVKKITNSLQEFPERFSKIPELSKNNNLNIRQCVCDNYRIIYQIKDNNIYLLTMLGGNLLDRNKINK